MGTALKFARLEQHVHPPWVLWHHRLRVSSPAAVARADALAAHGVRTAGTPSQKSSLYAFMQQFCQGTDFSESVLQDHELPHLASALHACSLLQHVDLGSNALSNPLPVITARILKSPVSRGCT